MWDLLIVKQTLLLLDSSPLGHPVLEAALVVVHLGETHLLEGGGGLSGTPAHHSVGHYDSVWVGLGKSKLGLEGAAIQLEAI